MRSAYLPAEKIPIAIFEFEGKLCLDLQRVFPPMTQGTKGDGSFVLPR
jgi:hypothetical protein